MAQNLWADGKYSAYTSPDLCYFPAIQKEGNKCQTGKKED